MMCVAPEDSRELCGPSGSREESSVSSLMTTQPTAVSAVLGETGLQAHSLEAMRTLSKKYLDILPNRNYLSRF